MLQQTQAKIMSTREFTNRLAFLATAVETCARSYQMCGGDGVGEANASGIKEGFGMLLFLPPAPKDADLLMFDNIACSSYYRRKLPVFQREEDDTSGKLREAEAALERFVQGEKDAKDALSDAKRAFYREESADGAAVADCEERLATAKGEASRLRQEIKELRKRLGLASDKTAACRQKLKALEKKRADKGLDAYCAFAAATCAFNGAVWSDATPAQVQQDPSLLEVVLDLELEAKRPTETDVSRLRTDCSNTAILGEFVSRNEVIAPSYAADGFPLCKTSFVRDSDADFELAVMAAARKRVMELIAVPEQILGRYWDAARKNMLFSALLGEEKPRFRREDERNIVYDLVVNEAFPVMVEEAVRPAVLEALVRFGQKDAQEEFARKLNVLALNEQTARRAYARAFDGFGEEAERTRLALLKARGEILALALSAALLGARGVSLFAVDMGCVQGIPTERPKHRSRGDGTGARAFCARLIERIPNAEGGFSSGRSVALDEGEAVQIGRAPFGSGMCQVIVPAGVSPAPGFDNFALSVSRSHAIVEFEGGCWLLSDAGSSHGTAVLGPLEDAELPDGGLRRIAGRLLDEDERTVLRDGDVIALCPLVEGERVVGADAHSGFSYRFELVGVQEG